MSLNRVLLIGRLGKDPEIRAAGSASVTNFSVATSESWLGKNGATQERTEWHTIVAWGNLGANCAKYLKKGKQVYVEGKIQTESYEKNGETRYATKIVAAVVKFLDSPDEKKEESPAPDDFPF